MAKVKKPRPPGRLPYHFPAGQVAGNEENHVRKGLLDFGMALLCGAVGSLDVIAFVGPSVMRAACRDSGGCVVATDTLVIRRGALSVELRLREGLEPAEVRFMSRSGALNAALAGKVP